MATRRDQLQSYQFLTQRVVSALVVHETDPEQPPLRRFVGSAFAGLMIAVIAIAGVAIYGIVVKGGKTTWRSENAIVLEKETGARYVFRDGILHPVANYTTARLLGASVAVSASANSLKGTPRGATLGIPGLPDALPGPKNLLRGAWTLCVRPTADEQGNRTARTVLLVGQTPSGGRPLAETGVLVAAVDDPEKRINLVWNNRRYEISDAGVVLKALTWDSVTPTPVRLAWLNGLTAGKPIGRITVAQGVSKFNNQPNGRLFFVRNAAGSTQSYVTVTDGLAKVSSMQADILRGDPVLNPTGTAPQEIQAGQVVESGTVFAAQGDQEPPAVTPKLSTPRTDDPTLCATYPSGQADPSVVLDATVPAGSPAGDTGGVTAQGAPLADRVVVPPGKGALVFAAPSPQSQTGTLLLVTEPGRAYPVTAAVVASQLGLGETAPVRLPTNLVNRVPVGPALDPATAGLPVSRP